VLRSLRHLRGPVRWLRPLLLIPAFLRDPLYDLIARNRYRWFGRRPNCFVPAPRTRDRFIDL
jgi:predicted DCC family thiol-disulfide oxidoreductase YuxK